MRKEREHMALVQVSPAEARLRWDRSAGRPSAVSWADGSLAVVGLEAVRDERAAYPAERGPRLTLVLRTRGGGRAAVVHDGRRWLLDAVEAA